MQTYVKPKGTIIPEPFLKKYLVLRASKTVSRYDDYYEETVYLALNMKSEEFITIYCPDIKVHEADPRRV